MANNNIKSLQLLRNTSKLYASREDALAALSSASVSSYGAQDGSPILARYKGEDGKIMTLVGYYAVASSITGAGTATTNVTVFDFEGNAAEITELENKIGTGITTANTVTDQLETLSGNSSTSVSGDTSVEGAKRYADEKVREGLDALDYTLAKNDNKVVVSLAQEDGKVSGESANITSIKLDGLSATADTKIASTQTLGAALANLQGQIDSMDLAVVSGDGEVITAVSEADGKVSASKTAIKDVKLTGYVKDTTKTGDLAATDDVEDALSKIENNIAAAKSATTLSAADKSVTVVTAATGTTVSVNIKSGAQNQFKLDTNNGVYTNLYLSGITPSSDNVKEEYALFNDGTQVASGTTVKVYKDSSIVEIYLGTSGDSVNATTGVITKLDGDKQYLNYVYQKADGTYEMTKINISSFLNEAEFASGVTWDATAGKVRGVVDSTSEKDGQSTAVPFLTVGANGFKISGIKDEITRQINLLDAEVTGGTTAGTATSNHIQVIVSEADGKLTGVTVTETNIADKSKLDELSGQTVSGIVSNNASITATINDAVGNKQYNIETDASKIKMSGFSSTSIFSAITPSSSITEAFGEVENVIEQNELTTSNALNDLNTRLSAETEARKAVDGQNGQTYVANASKQYISAATSLNDADILLNDAIENITSGWIAGVQVNGQDLPESANKVNVQISASNTAAESANAIVITQDATTKALTLQLGTLDAGTY